MRFDFLVVTLDAERSFDRHSVRNLACVHAEPEVTRIVDWSHCIAFLLRCVGCIYLFENELGQRSAESDGSGGGGAEADSRRCGR